MSTAVTAAPMVSLWLTGIGMTPSVCRLRYESSDPYPAALSTDTGAGVRTWTFARSLLAEGLFGHSGLGEVRVWRVQSCRDGLVAIALGNPGRAVHIYVPLEPLQAFVAAMHQTVPAGRELD